MSTLPQKHEAKAQPGLFFWAEKFDGMLDAPPCFIVVSQVDGFPATEACDDWFANESEADAMAKQLAEEYTP